MLGCVVFKIHYPPSPFILPGIAKSLFVLFFRGTTIFVNYIVTRKAT